MIAEAEAAARDYAAANGYVVTGKETGKSTGKVWDNRKYTTVEDSDAMASFIEAALVTADRRKRIRK